MGWTHAACLLYKVRSSHAVDLTGKGQYVGTCMGNVHMIISGRKEHLEIA